METKELVKKALDCVEVKVNLVEVCNILIDDVIEVALDKVVADSANKIDDAAKALIYPILEKEAKAYIAIKIAELEKAIAAKIAEIKA